MGTTDRLHLLTDGFRRAAISDKLVSAHNRPRRSRWVGACNSHSKPMSRIFTDWSIFSIPFLLWKKGSSGPVTQWRQLVSCDWSWHSYGSLIPGKFDLKINRSMKTLWQEYSGVACSHSSALDPAIVNKAPCVVFHKQISYSRRKTLSETENSWFFGSCGSAVFVFVDGRSIP